MRCLLLSCLACLILVSACKKSADNVNPQSSKGKNTLTVYCTDAFRKSGLESTTVPDFARKHECSVELVMFRSAAELSLAVKDPANYGKYDLAIGIDNSFAISDSLAVYFVPPEGFTPDQLTKECLFDPALRLLPYAYANLGLLYNTNNVNPPPQSFGELQNAKYLHQMAICDPHDSALGRATLYWSLALFGIEGYEHLWKSLRKNIYKSFPTAEDALTALKTGECSLMLGLNTVPAYLQELDPGHKDFEVSMLKEGSYLYIESIGLHRGSLHSSLAAQFIRHFLAADTQKMVVYKLGMFPANRKTLLPMHFAAIPFNSYSVNSRLSASLIAEQLYQWLEFWERLFSFQIS